MPRTRRRPRARSPGPPATYYPDPPRPREHQHFIRYDKEVGPPHVGTPRRPRSPGRAMTSRAAWRREVQASSLPNGVKVTAGAHAERGPHHWHDDATNEHAVTQEHLAAEVGK